MQSLWLQSHSFRWLGQRNTTWNVLFIVHSRKKSRGWGVRRSKEEKKVANWLNHIEIGNSVMNDLFCSAKTFTIVKRDCAKTASRIQSTLCNHTKRLRPQPIRFESKWVVGLSLHSEECFKYSKSANSLLYRLIGSIGLRCWVTLDKTVLSSMFNSGK